MFIAHKKERSTGWYVRHSMEKSEWVERVMLTIIKKDDDESSIAFVVQYVIEAVLKQKRIINLKKMFIKNCFRKSSSMHRSFFTFISDMTKDDKEQIKGSYEKHLHVTCCNQEEQFMVFPAGCCSSPSLWPGN